MNACRYDNSDADIPLETSPFEKLSSSINPPVQQEIAEYLENIDKTLNRCLSNVCWVFLTKPSISRVCRFRMQSSRPISIPIFFLNAHHLHKTLLQFSTHRTQHLLHAHSALRNLIPIYTPTQLPRLNVLDQFTE